MQQITKKQRATVFGFLALLFLSQSALWIAQQFGLQLPPALPAFLALTCLMGILYVLVRAGVLRVCFFAFFVAPLLGIMLFAVVGNP